MSFSWTKYLAADENLEKEFGISIRYRTASLVIIVLIAIVISFFNIFVAIMVLLLGILYWYYLKRAKHYAFTNKRIILVDSFIGENVVNIDYKQITDIEVTQSFFDQIGGWGTLTVNTAGTHLPEVNISLIDNPQAAKQTLDQIRGF